MKRLWRKLMRRRVRMPRVSDVVVAELTAPEGGNREWEGNTVDGST